MTEEEALTIICETAFEWAQEYGFVDGIKANTVWVAARLLRPDLEPTD